MRVLQPLRGDQVLAFIGDALEIVISEIAPRILLQEGINRVHAVPGVIVHKESVSLCIDCQKPLASRCSQAVVGTEQSVQVTR